jgi:hypothetical protein
VDDLRQLLRSFLADDPEAQSLYDAYPDYLDLDALGAMAKYTLALAHACRRRADRSRQDALAERNQGVRGLRLLEVQAMDRAAKGHMEDFRKVTGLLMMYKQNRAPKEYTVGVIPPSKDIIPDHILNDINIDPLEWQRQQRETKGEPH